MSSAISIFQGRFGRVALLNMDRSLVTHAHLACHVLLKFGGADSHFDVRGTTCPLRDDTAVLVNAWEPHAYVHRANAPQTFILALYIDPSWLGSLDRRLMCSGQANFFSRPCVAINHHVRQRTAALSARMLSGEPVKMAEAEEMVFDLLIHLIDGLSARRTLVDTALMTRGAVDFRIRKAIAWLHESISEPLDAHKLSREVGLSRPYFFAQFKRVTGLTPSVYLNTLRMEAAYGLLLDPRSQLIDVAQKVGFGAQSNFTRFFRQHQGVAPSEYRRVTQIMN